MVQHEQARKTIQTSNISSRARLDRHVDSSDKTHPSPAFGNQALQHLLQSRAIQAKLKISEPGDSYEQEADRVADQVMRMAESAIAGPTTSSNGTGHVGGSIQRTCSQCEDEVHRQAIDEEETDDVIPDETGMPKRERGAAGPDAADIENAHIPRDGGQVLSAGVRNFMEPRFGVGFSDVRVHTGEQAVQSSRDLRASAYTVGQDIYFNAGEYQPGSFEGRKLLAHELTHVVQQTGHGNLKNLSLQRKKKQCASKCAEGDCPQGKQRKVIRNDCGDSGPIDRKNYINALDVSLSSKVVMVKWLNGTTEKWPCSPNPRVTPKHSAKRPEKVGVKCSIKHTNRHRDGMAWFTGFKGEGLRIGFHDSQPVGPGCVSHGCVRLCCDKAEILNKNTWSDKTVITVA